MMAKIVQTAKQTVKAMVESREARFWSDGLGLPNGIMEKSPFAYIFFQEETLSQAYQRTYLTAVKMLA